MEDVVAPETQREKLTLAEINRRYPNEWCILVDVDFPDMKLTAGAVFAHSPDREAVRRASRHLRDCASIWTGKIRSMILLDENGVDLTL